jgi:hypothetical protein
LPGFVLLVGNAQPHQVQHGGGVERDNAAEVQRPHLDCDQRNGLVEQADDVEEAAGVVFGDNDGDMVELGVAGFLDIPVLDRADDVGLVGRA